MPERAWDIAALLQRVDQQMREPLPEEPGLEPGGMAEVDADFLAYLFRVPPRETT